MKQKKSWFKTKKVTGSISLISMIAGFLFLNSSNITGNVILDGSTGLSSSSTIGLFLIFCSAILAVYSVKN